MNQTYLKILSLLLACAFLLGMLPAAFAAEIPEETANTEPEVSTAPTEETTTPEEKEMEAESFAPLETSPERKFTVCPIYSGLERICPTT